MDSTTPSQRVWTIPNAISALRIVLIVVFAYLLMTSRDGWAVVALAAAGVSDFLDGFLARRWNQVTVLGRILDPAADRILTTVVAIGLGVRGIVPWWLVGVLLARDVVVGIALLIGRRAGRAAPEVTFLGKSATFALYVFLPLAYLAFERVDWLHTFALVGCVGAAVAYWVAGLAYVRRAVAPN